MTMKMKGRKETRIGGKKRSEGKEKTSVISRALHREGSLHTNCRSDAALEKGLGQLKHWAMLAPKNIKIKQQYKKIRYDKEQSTREIRLNLAGFTHL